MLSKQTNSPQTKILQSKTKKVGLLVYPFLQKPRRRARVIV